MDFPVFHLDFIGNRVLFAIIAIVHVIINHGLAVGAIPLIALMEWRGLRTGDERWDRLAYRILAVCFVVTTSVGALTGVGIWFSASLINPAAIGSLLRVFFWFWFSEWIVFVIEICLILVYFMTWRGWGRRHKLGHVALGALLALFSWLTMAVIVAILGFMMHAGSWPRQPSLLNGILNPIYGPQLLFRTPAAMVLAGFFTLLLIYFFTQRGDEFRHRAVRFVSAWSLAWAPLCLAGALVYWRVIPQWMVANNLAVALTTQAFERWHGAVANLIAASAAVAALVALWGLVWPRRLPRAALLVPFVLSMALVGYFERVREFIRKPYVIADYMYSNGLRVADYPLLRQDGLLAHATYVAQRTITDENRLAAGRAVFTIACTRCHTTTGVNGVAAKLTALYGSDPWRPEAVKAYLANVQNTRPFMPPVPGNEAEVSALADYLVALQTTPARLEGAQEAGVAAAPSASPSEATWPVPRDIPLPLPADGVTLQAVLVVAFVAHVLFVLLMVGGSVLTAALQIAGVRRPAYDALARAVAATITVNKSLAVVLGVAPLLTINVYYTVYFYAANALTGTAWIMIVPLVTTAFLLGYLHKWTWDRLAAFRWLHIGLGALAALIFLIVPLIFLSNINLMLFPEQWTQVRGWLSTLVLPNVLPRYLHFLLASLAVTGLFLLVYLTRPGYPLPALLPDWDRARLRRGFYALAGGATLGQFLAGPLVLFTLPAAGMSWFLVGVVLIGATLAAVALYLLWRELTSDAAVIGRRFAPIAVLLTFTVLCMGYGRHLYREQAIAPHRQAMARKTEDFRLASLAAFERNQSGVNIPKAPLGETVFRQTCASCHAVDRVLVGPPLTEIAQLYAGNADGIVRWTNAPARKRLNMPPMPPQRLGDEKLKAVAEYILRAGAAPEREAPAKAD